MLAAFLTGIEKMEIRDVPVPEPGPGEVLIRVRHVGVCGSDVHYYKRGRIGGQIVEYPFIIGHEAAGTVSKTGKGVAGFSEGDAVAIEPGMPCRACGACLAGKPNLCPDVKFLGTPPVEGAFREFIVMPAGNILPLPAGIDTALGALVEPLGVGLYAVDLARPFPGASVAVFGCGPIGLSIIICSLLAGAGEVVAVEKIPERAALAKKIGAGAVINPDESDPVREILRLTGGAGADFTYEAAGEQETLSWCAESAALLGKVVIAGIPEQDAWVFPSHTSRRKELVLQNVRRSAFTPERVIALLGGGRISAEGIITHRFPLSEVENALRLASEYGDGVVKAMIEL